MIKHGIGRIELRSFLLAVLAAWVTACNSLNSLSTSNPVETLPEDTVPGSVVVDTLTTAELSAAVNLPVEKMLAIGGEQSDATRFTDIDGLEYANQEVYVVDRISNSVRVFDNAGKLKRSFGRRGGGPGEMNFPRRIVLWHDTLLVMDDHAIHRFMPDGKFVSRANYHLDFTMPGMGAYSVVPDFFAVTSKGLVTAATLHVRMPIPQVWSDTTSLFMIQPTDGSVGPPFQAFVTNSYYALGSYWAIHAMFAPATDFAVMRDSRAIAGTRDGTAIDISENGKPVRRIVFSATRRPVETADIEAFLQRRADDDKRMATLPNFHYDAKQSKIHLAKLKDLPHARYYPVTGEMVVGDNNNVLIHRPDLSKGVIEWRRVSGPTVWNLMTPDFKLSGVVTLPNGFYPLIMRGDVVIGKTVDEDDVPSIAGYRIGGPGGIR